MLEPAHNVVLLAHHALVIAQLVRIQSVPHVPRDIISILEPAHNVVLHAYHASVTALHVPILNALHATQDIISTTELVPNLAALAHYLVEPAFRIARVVQIQLVLFA